MGTPKKKRMFSAENRAHVMQLVIGKPSGVVAEVGGQEFDLLPFNTAEGLRVFALLKKFASLFELIRADAVTEADIARAVGEEGDNILALVRSMLHRSANVCGADEEEVFAEWFGSLGLMDLVKSVVPKLIAANGLGDLLGNVTAKPQETATAPESPSSR
jgi:hypothetical protein